MTGDQRAGLVRVETVTQITRQLDALWAHISWCLNAPISTPACRPFWTWTAIAAVAVALLILWKLLAWLIKPLLVWFEEMKLRTRDRKIADQETMAQYKLDDSKFYSGSVPENVEQGIRDALAEKKKTDQQQRHHQLMDDKKR